MSDQHKFYLIDNENIGAYILDKTADSKLVVIDRKVNPPQVATFDLGENGDVKQSISQLNALKLSPVGFRDTSPLQNGRSSTNQTGTTRYRLNQQINCQDLVLVYANYYAVTDHPVANTNSISVKASIEINGTLFPVFFSGKRTVTIEGGGAIASDPVGVIINTTDTVYVRTYFDAGASGYIPQNAAFITYAKISASDGATYGSDLTDSGSVTDKASGMGFAPRAVVALSKGIIKAVLLVGDSIIDGTGDSIQMSLANSGFAARKLYSSKIGSIKISTPGENTLLFLTNLAVRTAFLKYCNTAIWNGGINDVTGGVPLATIQGRLQTGWKYLSSYGMTVCHTTITPTTTSTDLWLTTANQTVGAYESVRLALNAWLRDTSPNGAVAQSNGCLNGVFDVAALVETSGKWTVPSSAAFSGTVQSADVQSITDATINPGVTNLDVNGIVRITGGTGSGQSRKIAQNDYNSGKTIYITPNWTTTPDNTSTYEIWITPTQDGTHPTPSNHVLMSAAVNI